MRTKRPSSIQKKRLTFYLPTQHVDKLQALANQSVFVEQAILNATGWKEDDNIKLPTQDNKTKTNKKARITIYLPNWIVERLNHIKCQSGFVEKILSKLIDNN